MEKGIVMRTANLKVLAAVLCSSALLTGCDWFDSDDDSPVPDTTPAAFAFTDVTGVALSTVQTSNTVTITGIDTAAAISVTGGEYSIGCSTIFTGVTGTISNNQTVCVRHTSSSVPSTATNTVLTVGGVADTFTSTTVAADTTPDPFTFTDQTNVAPGSVRTSNAVTIAGINTAAAISVTGGEYSINGGAFTAAAGTVSNGDTVQLRHTAAATLGTATNTVLTVGGVADTFTSTTTANTLLPFLTGTGELKLFDPTLAASGANPVTVDTGLTPPATGGTGCSDCFPQATTFLSGTVSGTTISNIHTPRLAYIKRASGNISGGTVFKVDLVQGSSSAPVQISSIADACEFVSGTDLGDLQNVDNSIAVLERAGDDLKCEDDAATTLVNEAADNVATAIRLNSPTTGAGSAGADVPLALSVSEPFHAQTNSSGVITGYVTFEFVGATPVLALRDTNFLNPSNLLTMQDFDNANIRSTDFTHLFVTAKPSGQGLRLYRVESGGAVSSVLHTFASNAFFNPLDGAHDAANLYFSDGGKVLRIPQDATTESAVLLTEPVTTQNTIVNRMALDTGITPSRVVFEAQDNSLGTGGVFSVASDAPANTTATTLATNPSLGTAELKTAAQGRAYINMRNSTGIPDARKISTDGSGLVTTTSAYWAGVNGATTFDFAANSDLPAQFIFLATRSDTDGDTQSDDDTLSVVDPATGVTGITLGTIIDAQGGNGLSVFGLGRYALVNAHINRGSNNFDHDVYFVDAATANSLAGLATNAGSNDIPLVFN